jgi:hypothetical protein
MAAKVSVVPDQHNGVLLYPVDRDIIIETQEMHWGASLAG